MSDISLRCQIRDLEQEVVSIELQPDLQLWGDDDAWNSWEPVQVSNPQDSTHVLTSDNGIGVIEGGPPSAGTDDHVLYLLENTQAADVDIYADFEADDPDAGFGIAVRVGDGTAVVVWTDTGDNGQARLGVWEYDGQTLNETNEMALLPFTRPYLDVSGDGSTVTVNTVAQHGHLAGDTVDLTGTGGFGQHQIADVPSAASFQFADADATTYTNGVYELAVSDAPTLRRLALRLIGNQLTAKQWFPEFEFEPAWADVNRSATAALPATLDGSGSAPPATGQVGFLAAHLAATNELRVNDFQVTIWRRG